MYSMAKFTRRTKAGSGWACAIRWIMELCFAMREL